MNSTKHFFLLHKQGILVGLKIISVGTFGLLAWTHNSRFFAIFIILFFISTFFLNYRKIVFLIIITSSAFIIFNTFLLDNLVILKRVNVPFLQHPKSGIISLLSPDTGQYVFPPEVQVMSNLLLSNNINTYKLSDQLLNNIEIYQRIVGAAWPRKLENTSSNLFITSDEIQNYPDCVIIDQKENITLVECR